jgi:hypothetical protein
MRRSRIPVLAAACAALLLAPAGLVAQTMGGCKAHRPLYIESRFEVQYPAGCTGHDEPEIVPLSTAAGSATNLTWTVVLPGDGKFSVGQVGPAFWMGGPVLDHDSFGGQAYLEVQFYPDQIVAGCGADGSYSTRFAKGAYTVCSPVWQVEKLRDGIYIEDAAFNAMLQDSAAPGFPLTMNTGDTITVRFFTAGDSPAWHITVTDVSTGHEGTIVLNSSHHGPLPPAYGTQELGNSLVWGGVHDAPAAFVWEIGHDFFGNFCSPGQPGCFSYSSKAWANITPIDIQGVTFGDGTAAEHWAVVSNQGGISEDLFSGCKAYNAGRFCIYPWYSRGADGFHFGVHYPDTVNDYGEAQQFTQNPTCDGPFGANTQFCATPIE